MTPPLPDDLPPRSPPDRPPLGRRDACRRLALILGAGALLPAQAWQLQPTPLARRVQAAELIVVAEAEAVLDRQPERILGVGEEWTVRLHVLRSLKGAEGMAGAAEPLVVRFFEVAVQGPPGLRLHQPRVWLLGKAPGDSRWLAPASYTSVLRPSEEAAVQALLEETQAPASGTRPAGR